MSWQPTPLRDEAGAAFGTPINPVFVSGIAPGLPVSGTAADGAAVSGNPVRIAGKDAGGLTQDVITDTIGNLQVGLVASPATVSTLNSTTATLGIGGVFTGTGENMDSFANISVLIFSNVVSAINGLSFQFSVDGTNWDFVRLFTLQAGVGRVFHLAPSAQFFRVVYTNGGTAQTTFRMETRYHPVATIGIPADNFSTRTDTFTAAGQVGVTVDTAINVAELFAMQVKGTGGAATTWDIRLEGSLNGTNFSTILAHTNVTGDGAVVWSGALSSPTLFFRSRIDALNLGASATNVVVTILGKG